MKIAIKLLISFVILFGAFSISTTKIHAISVTISPATVTEQTGTVVLQIRGAQKADGSLGGTFWICRTAGADDCSDDNAGSSGGLAEFSFTADGSGNADIEICADGNETIKKGACADADFWHVSTYHARVYDCSGCPTHKLLYESGFTVTRFIPQFTIVSAEPPKPDTELTLNACGFRRPFNETRNNTYSIELTGTPTDPADPPDFQMGAFSGNINACGATSFGPYPVGTYNIKVKDLEDHTFATFRVVVTATGGTISGGSAGAGGASGIGTNPCSGGECCTALGCISTTVKGFTEKILTIAVGIAGGIALILMVIGSIRVLASSGDPKAVGAGREMIVAAVAGLLFLIFAVLILKFIGINILGGVPGI